MILRFFLVLAIAGSLFISCKNDRSAALKNTENAQISTGLRESSVSEVVEGYPDDIYCAEVSYFNPRTGTRSAYTLKVEVQENEVVQINFPNGGWIDQNDFSDAFLEDDGTTSFVLDNGYQYDIAIIGNAFECLDNVPAAVQCRGLNKRGKQCGRLTDNPNGLCWQHQDQE